MKLCECGCGQPTRLAKQDDKRDGIVKGQPMRFINHHHTRGSRNHKWNGGRHKHTEGYIVLNLPDHPRADSRGRVLEHIVIAEQVLGRHLPDGAEVHHVNGRRSENRNNNLVICENRAYHRLLHQRQRAIAAGAPAHWLKCWQCKTYDEPENLLIYHTPIHRRCKNVYDSILAIK